MTFDIVNNRNESRFELRFEGHIAIAQYVLEAGKIIFTHTEVPQALEGKGIGSALAKYALDNARNSGLKVIPLCPFIKAYIEKHLDYQDLL